MSDERDETKKIPAEHAVRQADAPPSPPETAVDPLAEAVKATVAKVIRNARKRSRKERS
ncbi:MAG: hypothetical protein U0610_03915 [bacterium]